MILICAVCGEEETNKTCDECADLVCEDCMRILKKEDYDLELCIPCFDYQTYLIRTKEIPEFFKSYFSEKAKTD